MYQWPLNEARKRLSYLIDRVMDGRPQCITKRGRNAVVVISMEEYRKLLRLVKPILEEPFC